MLANFASSAAEGSGSNSSVTTSVVGGADSGTSIGNSLGATTTNADQKEGESKRQQIPYSMPGVLHYLQHEWNFYELERARWENDRAELKARISFLMGERKAQENLKHDLVRRIKMLEYALKQERARFQQFVENSDGQQNGGAANNENDGDERTQAAISDSKSTVPLDIDAIVPPTNLVLNNNAEKQHEVNLEWIKARETLRQYLQEIGYTDKILDVRSFRVKSLLGLVPENAAKSGIEVGSAERALAESEQFILDTANAIKHNRVQGIQQSMLQSPNKRGGIDEEDSDSSSGGDAEADLDVDAVEAINEFSFLKKAMDSSGKEMAKGTDSLNNDPKSLKTIKENLKMEQQQRRQQNIAQAKQNSKDEQNLSKFAVPASLRNISVDAVHGVPPNTVQSAEQVFEEEKFEGIKAGFGEDDDDQTQRWNIRYTLRSHYDSIRAMQFHPVEPVLITASEDGTAKLWDLNHSALGGQKSGSTNDGSGKGSQFPQPATGIVDIEPIYTFRGHTGPILAMDLSPLGENCYTAGLDGVISCWTVPSVAGLDIYQNFDRNILQERLRGHTDAVWSLCLHSSSNRLISASSDGTIRIWIIGLADGAMPSPLLKTISEVDRPHSIDLVSTESQQLLSACAHAKCHIRDFETGQIVTQFQMNDNNGDDGPPGEINKILSHPTMPVTITAGEDRKIRFFDNNTGKLINSTMAHVEGVSTLAIESNGLYMLSASHDGSVRLWNAEKRICLQEIAAHRKKSGSGVMTVAFHPSRQLIGSAGADSLAKVYGKVRSSPRSSLIATASPPSSSGSSGASSLVGSPQKHQHTASSQL